MMGDEIKHIRVRFGESQSEFARRLGVDQSTLSRWETRGLPDRGFTKEAIERRLAELREPAQ